MSRTSRAAKPALLTPSGWRTCWSAGSCGAVSSRPRTSRPPGTAPVGALTGKVGGRASDLAVSRHSLGAPVRVSYGARRLRSCDAAVDRELVPCRRGMGSAGGGTRIVAFQGVCGPPSDALFAERAHPLVGEALPQGNACCSRGETGAGEVGQVQGAGGQQVVDDHPCAEPEAGGIHGEQSFAQGGADVV